MNAIANMARLTKAGAVIAWSGARVLPDEREPAARRLRCSPRDRAAPQERRRERRPTRRGSPRRSPRSAPPTSSSASSSPPAPTSSAASSPATSATCRTACRPSRMKRGARGRRGGARRPVEDAFRRVRPAGRRRLHRPGAQGQGASAPTATLQAGGGEGPAPRHRAALPARPRQLFLRRPPDRALASALAAPAARRRGRHARRSPSPSRWTCAWRPPPSPRWPRTSNDTTRASACPTVDWTRTARRVLTLEWIDGIPIADHAALARRRPRPEGARPRLMRSFLRHAMRDGFFHADMHQGNLFVDEAGPHRRRRFRHHGPARPEGAALPRRDPATASSPATTAAPPRCISRPATCRRTIRSEEFAQALRAIGEPIHGRTGRARSRWPHLLGQLFAYTEVFDMQTRPELLLLQKTMVVVEGVGRALDPELNMWVAAEPVVREWMEKELGAGARIEAAAEGAASVGRFVGDIPKLLGQAERTADAFVRHGRGGLAARRPYRRAPGRGARPREPHEPHRHLGRRARARGHRARAALLSVDR